MTRPESSAPFLCRKQYASRSAHDFDNVAHDTGGEYLARLAWLACPHSRSIVRQRRDDEDQLDRHRILPHAGGCGTPSSRSSRMTIGPSLSIDTFSPLAIIGTARRWTMSAARSLFCPAAHDGLPDDPRAEDGARHARGSLYSSRPPGRSAHTTPERAARRRGRGDDAVPPVGGNQQTPRRKLFHAFIVANASTRSLSNQFLKRASQGARSIAFGEHQPCCMKLSIWRRCMLDCGNRRITADSVASSESVFCRAASADVISAATSTSLSATARAAASTRSRAKSSACSRASTACSAVFRAANQTLDSISAASMSTAERFPAIGAEKNQASWSRSPTCKGARSGPFACRRRNNSLATSARFRRYRDRWSARRWAAAACDAGPSIA